MFEFFSNWGEVIIPEGVPKNVLELVRLCYNLHENRTVLEAGRAKVLIYKVRK